MKTPVEKIRINEIFKGNVIKFSDTFGTHICKVLDGRIYKAKPGKTRSEISLDLLVMQTTDNKYYFKEGQIAVRIFETRNGKYTTVQRLSKR